MMQVPLFKPQTEWTPPTEFPNLSKYNEIAIDLETKDPDLIKMGSGSVTQRGEVVGIAVAVKGWKGYFPIGHENGGNMDSTLVFSWLRDIFKDPNKTFIFHDGEKLFTI